jgi:hypothetical protein
MFEDDYPNAERLCRESLELAPEANEAFALLHQLKTVQHDWEGAVDVSCDWYAACGPSAGLLSSMLRSGYRVGNTKLVVTALDGMCSTPVDDAEFALAQACVADLGASSKAGSSFGGVEEDEHEAGESDEAAPTGPAQAAAGASAAGAKETESGATASDVSRQPPTAASVLVLWQQRCDVGREEAVDALLRAANACADRIVAAASTREPLTGAESGSAAPASADQEEEEAALAEAEKADLARQQILETASAMFLCLGLLAADACQASGCSALRSATEGCQRAVDALQKDTEARATDDENYRVALLVLAADGKPVRADSEGLIPERCCIVVARHCVKG